MNLAELYKSLLSLNDSQHHGFCLSESTFFNLCISIGAKHIGDGLHWHTPTQSYSAHVIKSEHGGAILGKGAIYMLVKTFSTPEWQQYFAEIEGTAK